MSEPTNLYKSATVNLPGSSKKIFLSIVVVLLLVWLASASFVIIDAGQTGIYSLFGKVKDTELRSGFHIINPFGKVQKLSVRTEQYTMSRAIGEGQRKNDDSITALTKEGLNVSLDITALYHLEETKASDVYRELGIDYEEKIIRPEIRGAIREIVARYDAKEVYSEKRQVAGKEILDYLKSKLDPRGIIAEDVVIRDVLLPANLTQAIQEKLKAEQESQTYEFLLAKEKKEAERKIIEAGGQRDAQKIINESLTNEYLKYLYIKELKDRQGTIYIPINPASGMPLFKGIGE